MLTLPPVMLSLLAPFEPLFRRRVWPSALVLVIGTLLAPGKRTVTAALRVRGPAHAKSFQQYHRVLNRAVWSSLEGSRLSLALLVSILDSTSLKARSSRPPLSASRPRRGAADSNVPPEGGKASLMPTS